MHKQLLNDNWQLHEAPLTWDKNQLPRVRAFEENWYSCNLPADVRMPLIENNVIKDPVLSDYCLESEWIEQRSWWFLKRFEYNEIKHLLDGDIVELVLERLDARADIFINGIYLGTHKSTHYPFVAQVKSSIFSGSNEIAVRITNGLEEVTDEMLSDLNWAVCTEYDNGGKYRGDKRRSFVRRPAYTIGWDWGPRVVTCGLTGSVYLRSYKNIGIRDASVSTIVASTAQAKIKVSLNIENLDIIGTKNADIFITVKDDSDVIVKKKLQNTLLTSGYNYIDCEIDIDNAKLWWPSGYGKANLYNLEISADCEGHTEKYPDFKFGVRSIKLDTSVISGEDRKFTVTVNDVPVFCKGGDWIPSDSIYARVSEQKIKNLLEEAVECNFNMLRIWGGGLYETDYFYQLCDEKGIMLWHDFMFACTTYPDHLEWWRNLVSAELDYQTKRLRSHASLAIFCGTNENHWIFNKHDNPRWGLEISHDRYYGLMIPNCMAKEYIHKNCPEVPYWNSSPYGGKLPNDDTIGDVHRWHDAFMSPNMENRINLKSYDHIKSKFVSEYGYVGPCSIESTRKYLDLADDEAIERSGRPWEIHTNVFEKQTVAAGIEKHYVDDASVLGIDDYLLYGGMVQSTILGYSLEAIRFKDFCSGALFWMYNDTWGEVGWTVIDYYLRRKIAYYGVKRALAHRKISIREIDGRLIIQAMNDFAEPVSFKLSYGYVSYDGKTNKMKDIEISLEPFARKYIVDEALPTEDYLRGSIAAITDNNEFEPVLLRMHEIKDLKYEASEVNATFDENESGQVSIVLQAEGYVHGVYIEGNKRCSDNYFDLLPGQIKKVTVENAAKEQIKIGQVR